MRKETNVVLILAVVGVIIVIGLILLGFKGGSPQSDANATGPAQQIMEELQKNGSVAELKVADIVEGEGQAVAVGDTVLVRYTGMLPNGTVFDSSTRHGGKPVPFPIGVGYVIPGWDKGIIGMKTGGTRLLVVPSEMAYGAAGREGIPPNSTLVFQVELVDVIPAGTAQVGQ